MPNLWSPTAVVNLARELAELAAEELTRSSGPVRDPQFQKRVQSVLSEEFDQGELPRIVRSIVDSSLHLCHPRFMAQQVAAPLPAAALVESVVAALNQSIAVWDMSPAGTMIDRDLLRRFAEVFGFGPKAGGSLVPGGSFANLTALLAARAALAPRAWRKGAARIAVLAGAHVHYSITRAAGILGLGSDSVFPVPVTAEFRTDPSQLTSVIRKARSAGFRRFVLVASSGSTATGSCDDLNEFADAAHRYHAWLHVDAAHGGGFVFSPKYRKLLAGIARADSITFDPHKMLFMPLAAGALLLRDGSALRNAFEQSAPYLFGARDRAYPDIGESTIACSQRFDGLKIWLTWKAYSGSLWGQLIERTCEVARAAYVRCLESAVFEPAHEPQCNIFCFRLRHPPAKLERANALHLKLKEQLNSSGEGYVSSTVLNGRRVLRIVVMNPRTTSDDVGHVLFTLERLAKAG